MTFDRNDTSIGIGVVEFTLVVGGGIRDIELGKGAREKKVDGTINVAMLK